MLYTIRRLLAWFCRGRLDDELREEIQRHLELRREQLIAGGMDPCEASAAARRAFGNPTRVREETRDMWGIPSLDSLMQDLRYGTRVLWRSPSFTAVAVLSLALGIGSTAAVFSIADAVLFRPLAVGAPQELHEFRATAGFGAAVKHLNSVSAEGLRSMSRAAEFAQFVGFRTLDDGLLGGHGSESQAVRVELVSDAYFDVLGVRARAGRLLTHSDAGLVPVPIVLSERIWRSRFAADAKIDNRPVTLNGTPAIVVGVARAFRGVLAERPADVMVPAAAGALIDPATASTGLRLLVRLRPEVASALAEQRIATLYSEVSPDWSDAEIRVSLTDASRGASDAREPLHQPVVIGLALVGVLLLVACANAGGLLLTRFTSRTGEFGVRIAIGAGRGRLMRQLIIEALLVAGMAAAAGLLVAYLAAPLLLGFIPLGSSPLDFELRFDWRLAGFAAALAAGAALIAAGASIVRLLQSDTSTILTHNTRAIVRGRRRGTEILIAAQVACALLLVVAAAAMTRTLINLGRVDPGFDPAGVIVISVDASGRAPDEASLRAYFAQLHERIASAPQITRVSSTQFGLMTTGATTGTVEIPGWSPVSDEDRWVRLFWVGPEFFEALRMPLLAGSSLGRAEAAGPERVAVVNRAFAEFYFGSVANAVGRMVNRKVRIVGVTADAHYGTLRDEPVRAMFVPYTQAPTRTVRTFLARTTGDTSGALRSALVAIRAYDSKLTMKGTTLSDQIATTLSRERFVAVLASVLSALALVLSCAGLYAAVAYSVAERRKELAVRLALGATGKDIVRLVLRDPLRVTLIGLLLGIPGAYAIMRTLAALLFDVAPFDIPSIAVCGLALMAVAAVAALWPARRAATINPQECLKST